MRRFERLTEFIRRPRRAPREQKIFCVGRNKTGTTSLASFFRMNGYLVGDQEKAEQLMEDWVRRDFARLISYCRTAEVFQDVPFSLPDTYEAMDKAFPGSKFILTVRNSAEDWYNSLVTHHSRKFSSSGGPPSETELARAKYRGKYAGFILFLQKAVYGYPSVPLYDKTAYMAHYEAHNARVIGYFKSRPVDLLVLNLSDDGATDRLCRFVGIDPVRAAPLPFLNRSGDMRRRGSGHSR